MVEAKNKSQVSFTESVASGMSGWLKGMLYGGAMGAIGGAVIYGLMALMTGGTSAVAGAAIAGMIQMGIIGGGLGATAGLVTGVVKSRETGGSAEEMAHVANVSFTQGVAVGQQAQQGQSTYFRDMIEKQRAQAAQQRTH